MQGLPLPYPHSPLATYRVRWQVAGEVAPCPAQTSNRDKVGGSLAEEGESLAQCCRGTTGAGQPEGRSLVLRSSLSDARMLVVGLLEARIASPDPLVGIEKAAGREARRSRTLAAFLLLLRRGSRKLGAFRLQ